MTGGVTQQYMSVACGLHMPTVYSTHYPSYRAHLSDFTNARPLAVESTLKKACT